MKNDLISRCYSVDLETRENDNGQASISGIPIVYNSRTDLGWFDEIIDYGALNETNLNDVRLCLNHDTSYVYARSRRNNPNSTMRLSLTEKGLEINADLAVNESPKAKDFYSAVKRGDIDKMSFMFSIDQERWEDLESDHPTRHVEKIGSVVEVSAVTFPAYDATEINARSKDALDKARLAVETARKQNAENSLDKEARSKELELAKAQTEMLLKL